MPDAVDDVLALLRFVCACVVLVASLAIAAAEVTAALVTIVATCPRLILILRLCVITLFFLYTAPELFAPLALAAASVASKTFGYVPQRHRLPLIAACTSSKDGLGLSSSSAAQVITIPGVQ